MHMRPISIKKNRSSIGPLVYAEMRIRKWLNGRVRQSIEQQGSLLRMYIA